jgi:PPOX class probable F420-dependent enzyme
MEQQLLDLSKPRHARADQRLRSELMMWISTVRPDGRPHLVPVWFLWDGERVIIFSKPDQKIRNLKQNPQVVLALDDTDGGEDVVLIDGEATLPERGTLSPAMPTYAEKYAAKLAAANWTGESMGEEYTEPIVVRPTRIRAW